MFTLFGDVGVTSYLNVHGMAPIAPSLTVTNGLSRGRRLVTALFVTFFLRLLLFRFDVFLSLYFYSNFLPVPLAFTSYYPSVSLSHPASFVSSSLIFHFHLRFLLVFLLL